MKTVLSLLAVAAFSVGITSAVAHDMAEFYRIYSGMTGIPAQFTDEKLRDILKFTATMRGQEHPGVPFQEMARMVLVTHNYEKIQKIQGSGSFDPWSKEIIEFVKSGNEEQTAKLLLSAEPVKRWVALKKVKELGLLKNDEIAKRVESIFNDDSYILIGRKWKKPAEGQQEPATENYIEVFSANNREEAASLMGKESDSEKVSADGLLQMNKYVEDHPEEKLAVTSVLLQMDPVDEKMKEAQSSIKDGTFWVIDKSK